MKQLFTVLTVSLLFITCQNAPQSSRQVDDRVEAMETEEVDEVQQDVTLDVIVPDTIKTDSIKTVE